MFKDDIKFCKQIYNKIYYVGESGRFYYESWEELERAVEFFSVKIY